MVWHFGNLFGSRGLGMSSYKCTNNRDVFVICFFMNILLLFATDISTVVHDYHYVTRNGTHSLAYNVRGTVFFPYSPLYKMSRAFSRFHWLQTD